MKFLVVLAGLFLFNMAATLLPSQRVLAAEEDKTFSNPDAPKPYSMNVKNYTISPQAFYDAAYRALIKRGWKVEIHELSMLVGSRSSGSQVYKVGIRFANDLITIGYMPGFQHDYKRNWLKNLGIDIKKEITPLKKKILVVPPAPSGAQPTGFTTPSIQQGKTAMHRLFV